MAVIGHALAPKKPFCSYKPSTVAQGNSAQCCEIEFIIVWFLVRLSCFSI
eukprot:m.372254 g.372254  ORF g.372254 m.372254 type:complete len:50 (+) comp62569_c0_seq1:104-253(+)